MNNTKPIISFDMDQTLISSNVCHILAYKQMLKEMNIKYEPKDWKEILRFKRREESIKKMCPQFNETQVKKAVKIYLNCLHKIYYKKVKREKYALEVLKKLKPIYKIAVITNCQADTARILIGKGAKIPLKYFDLIIGSSDVKNVKPSPEPLKLAERKLKSKIIAHIGDSTNDIKAAHDAGTNVISINTGNHKKSELLALKPNYFLENLKDVPKIIAIIDHN